MLNFLKDIIAPKKCYSCNKEGHFLCPQCMSKIIKFENICYVCKKNTNGFSIHNNCLEGIFYNKIIILLHYNQNLIKKLIKDAKFYNKKEILNEFSFYMGDLLLKNINEDKENYILISVPMYFFRKWKRGYNQSEILAKNIGLNTGIKTNLKIFKRINNTRQQSKLSRQQRLLNLEKAFKTSKKELDKIDKNKTIIIVDDVISTGTTINTISKILKNQGFKKMIGLCIASD